MMVMVFNCDGGGGYCVGDCCCGRRCGGGSRCGCRGDRFRDSYNVCIVVNPVDKVTYSSVNVGKS